MERHGCARSFTDLATALQSSDSAAREQLEKVVEILDSERCTTFEECIAWARGRFQVSPHPGMLHPPHKIPHAARDHGS